MAPLQNVISVSQYEIDGDEHLDVESERNKNNCTEKLVLQNENVKAKCETSSDKCNQGHLVSKLKNGFLQRVNYVVSRLFHSKLWNVFRTFVELFEGPDGQTIRCISVWLWFLCKFWSMATVHRTTFCTECVLRKIFYEEMREADS